MATANFANWTFSDSSSLPIAGSEIVSYERKRGSFTNLKTRKSAWIQSDCTEFPSKLDSCPGSRIAKLSKYSRVTATTFCLWTSLAVSSFSNVSKTNHTKTISPLISKTSESRSIPFSFLGWRGEIVDGLYEHHIYYTYKVTNLSYQMIITWIFLLSVCREETACDVTTASRRCIDTFPIGTSLNVLIINIEVCADCVYRKDQKLK